MSGSPADATAPGREGYPHVLTLPTRWTDNDVYGHVNNVEYYAFFDTVINAWLIARGRARHPRRRGDRRVRRVALHVPRRRSRSRRRSRRRCASGELGNSSVRYEIGLFAEGADEPAADGLVRARVRRPRGRAGRSPIPDGCAPRSSACVPTGPRREGPRRRAARDGPAGARTPSRGRWRSPSSSSTPPGPGELLVRVRRGRACATPTCR